jgi:hypothetical protein
VPESLWGAERIAPAKIEFRYIETSNANVGLTLDEIEVLDNYKRIMRARAAKETESGAEPSGVDQS